MVGAFKAVLIAIVAAVVLIMVVQLAVFFPFYMTIVVETANISNIAANDNYVKQIYYDAAIEGLRSRPIFKEQPDSVNIQILNSNGGTAVGFNDEFVYNQEDGEYYMGAPKPYTQRGNPVTVTVSAVYPVKMTLWGREITYSLPVSFSMTSLGLKYYKDLD